MDFTEQVKSDMLDNVIEIVSTHDEFIPIAEYVCQRAQKYIDNRIPKLVSQWYEISSNCSNPTDLENQLNSFTERFFTNEWNPKIKDIIVSEYKAFQTALNSSIK